MPNPFLVLSDVSAPSASAYLTPEDVELIARGESDAYGHWLLGPDAASLTSIMNSKALTAQGSTPTFNATNAEVLYATGEALLTDLDDAVDLSVTFALVTEIATAQSGTGVWLGGGLTSTGGYAILKNASDQIGFNDGANTNFATGLTLPFDEPIFIGITCDVSSTSNNVSIFIGGVGSETFSSDATSRTASGNKIAVGNVDATNRTGNHQLSEFIFWNSAKTVSELQAIYTRSRSRMAERSVALHTG